MLENDTDQGVSVECGFRFLKDPLFFANSMFLKKLERIMALRMIMGLALLIYALGERQLRQPLEKNNETIPDQKGKLTQMPTIRWMYQIFEGIDVLSIWVNDRRTLREVLNVRPVHQQIIRMFGSLVSNCYLLDSERRIVGKIYHNKNDLFSKRRIDRVIVCRVFCYL